MIHSTEEAIAVYEQLLALPDDHKDQRRRGHRVRFAGRWDRAWVLNNRYYHAWLAHRYANLDELKLEA